MGDVPDQWRDVRGEDRVRGARSASRNQARRPVLATVVRHNRIDQLRRFAQAIVFREPYPAAMPQIRYPTPPDCPVAFVSVTHAIDTIASRVIEIDVLAAVA